jgi:hypothetical protein
VQTSLDNLGQWDVENVVDMTSMFDGANDFNQAIDGWGVSKVTSFTDMFKGAGKFNKDINEWAVNSGSSYGDMFNGASQFLQNLCDWQGHNFLETETNSGMFTGTKCPTTTVDASDLDPNTGSLCCGCTTAETTVGC